MKFKALFIAASLAMGALTTSVPAAAAIIGGVYGTGVDGSGNVAANGSTEQHYTLVNDPYPVVTPQVRVTTAATAPASWLGNSTTSAWISARSVLNANSLNVLPGEYTWRLTFDLTGLNAATAQITGQFAADNSAEILLNGVQTGFSSAGFTSYSSFALTSGFLAGQNTLDFRVINNSAGFSLSNPLGTNPTGLRGDIASATADVPEPGSLALMAGAMVGGLFVRRRRQDTV